MLLRSQTILLLLLVFLPAFEGVFSDFPKSLVFVLVLPLGLALVRRKVLKDRIFWAFSLFLGLAFVSTLFSVSFSRSINAWFFYFFYFVAFLTVRDGLDDKKRFSRIFLTILLAVSAIACFFSFYYLALGAPPPFESGNLIFANFGHNHLVDLLVLSLPVAFCLFLTSKTRKQFYLWLALVLVFVSGFVLSFSRGGIFFAILALALCLVFNKKAFRKKKLTGWFLVLVLFGSLFFFLNSRLLTWQARVEYWRQAAVAFWQRPVFGTGLDTFRLSSIKHQKVPDNWSSHVHNHFLQMFSETGIFGGMAFLVLIGLILKKGFKNVGETVDREKNLMLGFFVGILTSCLHSLVDYDWQFPAVFLIFWVMAGIVLKKPLSPRKTVNTRRMFKIIIVVLSFACFIFGLSMGTSEALFLKGLSFDDRNQDKAVEYFEKSLMVFPFYPQRMKGVVEYFSQLKRYGLASSFGKKLLETEKNDLEANKLVLEVFLEKSERKELGEALLLFLENTEDIVDFEGLVDAFSWEQKMKISEALKTISEDRVNQLEKYPRARYYFWISSLLSHEREWWEYIIGWLENAVELEPKNENYKEFLGDIRLLYEARESFFKEDYEKARKLSEKLIKKVEGKSAEDLLFYKRLYFSRGFEIYSDVSPESLYALEKMVEFDPWNEYYKEKISNN